MNRSVKVDDFLRSRRRRGAEVDSNAEVELPGYEPRRRRPRRAARDRAPVETLPEAPEDFLSQAAEVGRAVTRGVQDTFEFAGDVYDIAPLPRVMLKGVENLMEGRDVTEGLGDTLFDFTGESPGDRLRARAFGERNPTAKELTAEQYRRGDSSGLDRAKSVGRFVGAAGAGGGLLGRAARTATGIAAAGGYGAESIAEALGADEEDIATAGTVGNITGAVAPAAPGLYRLGRTGASAAGNWAMSVASRLRRMFDTQTPSRGVSEGVIDDVVALATPGTPNAPMAERQAATLRRLRASAGEEGPLSARLDSDELRAAERNTISQAVTGGEREAFASDLNLARGNAAVQVQDDIGQIAPAGMPNASRTAQQRVLARSMAAIDDQERAALSVADETEAGAVAAANRTAQAEIDASRAKFGAQKIAAQRQAAASTADYPSVPTSAAKVSDELATRVAQVEARSKAAWAQVDPAAGPINKMAIRRTIDRAIDEAVTDPVMRRDFRKRHAQVLYEDMADQELFPGRRVPGVGVNSLKTRIRDTVRATSEASGVKADNRIATTIGNRLLDLIGKSRGTQRLKAAVAASRDEFAVNTGPLRKARKAAARKGAGTEAETLTRPGASGSQVRDMVSAKNDPKGAVRASLMDNYRAQFKAVLKGRAKNVAKARNWLEARAPALKVLGLTDEFDAQTANLAGVKPADTLMRAGDKAIEAERTGSLSRAKAAAVAARTEGTRTASQARTAAGKTPTAQFGSVEDSYKAAQTALKSKTPRSAVADIMRAAKAEGPRAVEDTKAAFRDAVLRSTTKPDPRVHGKTVFGNSALDYMKQNREALSEVFGADEMARLEKGFKQVQRNLAGTDVSIPPEASARSGGIREWFTLLAARVGGAGFITSVLKLPSLIAANTATREATRVFKKLPDEQYRRALARFLARPEELEPAINALKTARTKRDVGTALDKLVSQFADMGGAAVGAAAQTNEE